MGQGVIFLQLNEINFDLVQMYIEKFDDLPNFKKLMTQFYSLDTFSEEQYELLEPWIQWVSVHTGKSYAEHGVFRLGDVVHMPSESIQLLEYLENTGLKVGAISPMNMRNALKKPAYFIPDPWTDTPSDESGFSTRLAKMLRQTVNDNATGNISLRSLGTLLEAVLRTLHPRRTVALVKLIFQSLRKPWLKATILDAVIHSIHLTLFSKKRPDISFVFLNAGAHIQHHYLLNSEMCRDTKVQNPDWYMSADQDPVRDMLRVYDGLLADYLALVDSGVGLMVATGLTQVPYDRVKFYYRLKDHCSFLEKLGIQFKSVNPRMTRDFEIVFACAEDMLAAAEILEGAHLVRSSTPIFSEVEVREDSLFVTLTYPDEIRDGDVVVTKTGVIVNDFHNYVTFVAIKNGKHSSKGFSFFSDDVHEFTDKGPIHVSELFELSKRVVERAS